jgi:hypothetical protein
LGEAEVFLNVFNQQIVVDWLQGIEVKWSFDSYTGATHVYMSIFVPLSSLPSAQETHVEDIELSARKDHGLHKVYAWAEILEEHNRAATSATVYATWIMPNGSTQPVVEDFVGVDGVAFFELIAPRGRAYRGIYTLRIDDIELDGYTFDLAGSVLEGTVYIK